MSDEKDLIKKEVEKDLKKQNHIAETVAAFMVLILVLAGIAAGAWYYLASQPDDTYLNLRTFKKVSIPAGTDEFAKWQSYVSQSACKYSVKYPEMWVSKSYGLSANALVAFADKTENLPPENSDAYAMIGVTCETADLSDSITTSTDKITKETVTVAGVTAKKWTLLPGREDDMIGDTKIVYVSVPLASGKFVLFSNVADRSSDIFSKMLTTFKAN